LRHVASAIGIFLNAHVRGRITGIDGLGRRVALDVHVGGGILRVIARIDSSAPFGVNPDFGKCIGCVPVVGLGTRISVDAHLPWRVIANMTISTNCLAPRVPGRLAAVPACAEKYNEARKSNMR